MKILFAIALVFVPVTSFAGVDLPWSTTYDCVYWGDYTDTLDCDGLTKNSAGSIEPIYEEITADANRSNGVSGTKGQRHWVQDGKNYSTGGTVVEFNTPQTEIWIRLYVRFQAGFVWNPSVGYKLLYIYKSDSSIPFYLPLWTDQVGFSIPPAISCSDCGWVEYSMNDGDWYLVELHMKRESEEDDDGIIQVWINEDLIVNDSTVDWDMYGTGEKFDGFRIASNADSPDNDDTFYIDYDDIAVSNTGYIGPTTTTKSIPLSGGSKSIQQDGDKSISW